MQINSIIIEVTKVESGRFHFPDDTTLVLISDEDQSELIHAWTGRPRPCVRPPRDRSKQGGRRANLKGEVGGKTSEGLFPPLRPIIRRRPRARKVEILRLGGGLVSRLGRRPFLSETVAEAMNYREEIETALNRDGKLYGKVWRGETDGLSESDLRRIWKQIHVMLDRKAVKTTPAQKKRWAKRMSGFARRQCLSRITAAEIARRAERCILDG